MVKASTLLPLFVTVPTVSTLISFLSPSITESIPLEPTFPPYKLNSSMIWLRSVRLRTCC